MTQTEELTTLLGLLRSYANTQALIPRMITRKDGSQHTYYFKPGDPKAVNQLREANAHHPFHNVIVGQQNDYTGTLRYGHDRAPGSHVIGSPIDFLDYVNASRQHGMGASAGGWNRDALGRHFNKHGTQMEYEPAALLLQAYNRALRQELSGVDDPRLRAALTLHKDTAPSIINPYTGYAALTNEVASHAALLSLIQQHQTPRAAEFAPAFKAITMRLGPGKEDKWMPNLSLHLPSGHVGLNAPGGILSISGVGRNDAPTGALEILPAQPVSVYPLGNSPMRPLVKGQGSVFRLEHKELP